MRDILTTKEIIQRATLWDSQGNETIQFLFVLGLTLTFLSEKKYKFQGTQNKRLFEIILHVW